ncbi:type II toxin-antitoxin system VapC family toxin [Acidobacteria bacterium AH-259-L09]|nr:type II toxin-antitoxin system VapC family toxin [Acidobacteria bacterium AH-259-L09]
MNLYAESSAVLAWLMGEAKEAKVRELLSQAELILASDLTLLECERVLIRAVVTEQVPEAEAEGRRAILNGAATHWNILRLHEGVVERARRPFPKEPLRTLDALHLACALSARSAIADIAILSLDRRIRSCARALGFPLAPK